ncbi:hypothetical protein MKI84_01705 [Ancylobacter sp. A5.8]|uniref:hypothetical protein n=1 Tax=Ancylobacter gelatini TaxID=2919920 RepID=UPI001F4D9832|nr:hypothetical protein [Ancylobacter gelatini]MCJ8141624.1 hypothetical protein [Ancylobacter gelatini]
MSLPILFFGAFGGVSPSVMKLASTLVTNPIAELPLLGFFVGLGLYAVLGGGLALALGEQNLRGALFAGIAAPALISNAITGAQDARMQPQLVPAQPVSLLFSTAHAQEATPEIRLPSPTPGDRPNVLAIIKADPAAANIAVPVCFLTTVGATDCVDQQTVSTGNGATVVSVPTDALGVRVAGDTLPLTGQTTTIAISAERIATSQKDFWWALGGRRATALTDVRANLVK